MTTTTLPRYHVAPHPDDPAFWQITNPSGRSVGLATSRESALDYADTLARMTDPRPPLPLGGTDDPSASA